LTGVRTAPPAAGPAPPYKNAAGSWGRRRRRGLLVLLPSTAPRDEEDQPKDHGDHHGDKNPRENVEDLGRARMRDDRPGGGEGLRSVHRHEDRVRGLARRTGPAREPVH